MELVLQIGALVVWLGERDRFEVRQAGEGYTVLCIGDSWTHGVGSQDLTTGSYPARLERKLQERLDDRWRVVNGGQAGQNSRDVLERLPGQLAGVQPDWVLVLVGQNDFWSTPERITVEPGEIPMDPGAFRWRFRTARLVDWALGKWSGAGQVYASERRTSPPWNDGGETWTRRAVPGWPGRLPAVDWARDERTRDGLRHARTVGGQEALVGLESLYERRQDDPRILSALATQRRRNGNLEGARELLNELRSGWDREQGDWWAECWSRALLEVGERSEAVSDFTRLCDAHPDNGPLLSRRAMALFLADRADEAQSTIERAWTLGGLPEIAQRRFLIWRNVSERVACESLVGLYLLNNDAEQLAEWSRSILRLNPENRAVFAELIDSADGEVEAKRRLTRVIEWVANDEADGRSAKTKETLHNHLEQIRDLVEGSGARCAFLTYPLPNDGTEELRAMAADEGAPFLPIVDLYPTWEWDRLRAPDGHCNDDGYAIYAEMVALWLARRLDTPGADSLVGMWRCELPKTTLMLSPGGEGYLNADPIRWVAGNDALSLTLEGGVVVELAANAADGVLSLQVTAEQSVELRRVE